VAASLFDEVQHALIVAGESRRRATVSEAHALRPRSPRSRHRSPSPRRVGGRGRGGMNSSATRRRVAALARRITHAATEELREVLLTHNDTLADAFASMDRSGNGVLSALEFRRGLQSLTGVGLSAAQLELIMAEVDRDGDDVIDYAEFIEMFRSTDRAAVLAAEVGLELRRRLRRQRAQLLAVFEDFDTNGDGVLSAAEMKRGLQSLGMELSKDEMAQLLQVVDANGDGALDYREFLAVVAMEPGAGGGGGSTSPRHRRSRHRSPSPRRRRHGPHSLRGEGSEWSSSDDSSLASRRWPEGRSGRLSPDRGVLERSDRIGNHPPTTVLTVVCRWLTVSRLTRSPLRQSYVAPV
jgi:Ca2+-binding EF-hand superfamily protein